MTTEIPSSLGQANNEFEMIGYVLSQYYGGLRAMEIVGETSFSQTKVKMLLDAMEGGGKISKEENGKFDLFSLDFDQESYPIFGISTGEEYDEWMNAFDELFKSFNINLKEHTDDLSLRLLEVNGEVSVEVLLDDLSEDGAEELSDIGLLEEYNGNYFASKELLEIVDEENLDLSYGKYLRELAQDILEMDANVASSRKIEGLRNDYDVWSNVPQNDAHKVTINLKKLASEAVIDFKEWLWNSDGQGIAHVWDLSEIKNNYSNLLERFSRGCLYSDADKNGANRDEGHNPHLENVHLDPELPYSREYPVEKLSRNEISKALSQINQETDSNYRLVEIKDRRVGGGWESIVEVEDYNDSEILLINQDIPDESEYALVEIDGWSFWQYPAKKAEYVSDVDDWIQND